MVTYFLKEIFIMHSAVLLLSEEYVGQNAQCEGEGPSSTLQKM